MIPANPRSRYLLILAVVAVSVLVVGWRLRPSKSADALSSQADISRLQRLTQRTNLENMATYFSEVAERVKASLVWVEGLETAGIVWEQPGAILSAVSPIHAAAPAHLRGATDIDYTLLTDLYSETPEFRLLRAPPELPTVSLQITPAGALRQGSWLALIRRNGTDTYEMEATLFSGTRAISCGEVSLREMLVGLAADNRPLGAGAFDLEGRFFGVVLECDGVRRLITAESLGRAIDRARAIDSQLLFRYGFRPVGMTPAQFDYFSQPAGLSKPTGLLVREVWRDTLAWDRGIRPGDLCLALDNEPLKRLDELQVMTVPMYRPEYTLTFRRGRSDRKVVFPPGAGLTAEPEFQRPSLVTFVSPLPAIAVHLVQANSAAARAGLLPGDRLVSAGPQFAAVRPSPELFAEERNEPLFLVVERGHAFHGLFLSSQAAR